MAQLLNTEMEVLYFPNGGSITDYVMEMFDLVIGVSVTRAMKFDGSDFTFEDAKTLLSKKLKGIVQSSRNSDIEWQKQILHVWFYNENVDIRLLSAWNDLQNDIKTNTVMVMTFANNSTEVFFDSAKEAKSNKAKISKINKPKSKKKSTRDAFD